MNSFSYSKYPIFINHEKSETPTMKDVMKETPADITEDFTNAYHDNDDETIVEALLIAPDDVVVDEKFYEKVLNVDNYEPIDDYSTVIHINPDNLQLYRDLCTSTDIQLEFQ